MTIETEKDMHGLILVGRAVALALREMRRQVRAGMTTAELDAVGAAVFAEHGARSAPQLFYGFPGVNCISVNDEAVHGIPGNRVLQPSDLVKIDVTAELNGYVADAAVTVPLERASPRATALTRAAESAFRKALAAADAGRPLHGIGRAIEREVRRRGFRVLPELHSHGVGRSIHEPPSFPQYYDRRFSQPLTEGLVITIEPIVTAGHGRSVQGDDEWTIKTADGSLSAHFEHTVIIAGNRPLIVTAA